MLFPDHTKCCVVFLWGGWAWCDEKAVHATRPKSESDILPRCLCQVKSRWEEQRDRHIRSAKHNKFDFQGQVRAGWETRQQLSWKWHNFYFSSRLNCILPEKYATHALMRGWEGADEPSKLVISLIFFIFSYLKLFLGYLVKSGRKGNDARYGLLPPLYLPFFLYSWRRSIF